ncbi:hypothetical protein ABPG77_004155 [Micractinium sp. CCAP 211/92]
MASYGHGNSGGKVFRDNCVAGDYVKLSSVAVSIIDTPIFQRLRYLKQLGMTEFVYPGATHTRFAHSLGVAHRARELGARLRERQPELAASDRDLLLLEVAGLCHDLGHGPFSHAFETELVPKLLKEGEQWEHERMSCRLLDHIVATYRVDLSAEELARVKDLMLGELNYTDKADWAGREWMFDVVANKRNGLDVDKLDYLKRDNVACGELTTSEFSALYENMRVIRGEVCFRASVRSAVQDVYAARAKLHEWVYTHPVCKAVEYMCIDAMLLAAEELGIAAALHDPDRYALLDDTIIRDIERLTSKAPNVLRAQELLRRLRHRDIYKIVASVDVPQSRVLDFPKVTAADVLAHQDSAASGVLLQEDDVRIQSLRIDFTAQHRNPLEHVGMYINDEDEEPHYLEVPFAPGFFVTRQVRIFLTRLCDTPQEKERYQAAARAAFTRWKQQALPNVPVLSPQKSSLTASARKRRRTDSEHGATGGSSSAGATAAAGAAVVATAADSRAEADDEAEPPACSQSQPPAKKQLAL